MEASASAPELGGTREVPNYEVPRTGIVPRVLNGNMSKDKGTYSSRIAQIIRQAEKYPGPGKYIGHVDYGDEKNRPSGINAFPKSQRDYKPCNKTPAPGHYEDKDFVNNRINDAKETLSKNPRTIYGKIPAGRKISFTAMAEKHSTKGPGPGHYEEPKGNGVLGGGSKCKLDAYVAAPSLTLRTREKSRNPPNPEPGPGSYSPNYDVAAEVQACYTVPKGRKKNFIDKEVAQTWLSAMTKTPSPGPGHFNNTDVPLDKLSRGAKMLQLKGMTRNATTGYM